MDNVEWLSERCTLCLLITLFTFGKKCIIQMYLETPYAFV